MGEQGIVVIINHSFAVPRCVIVNQQGPFRWKQYSWETALHHRNTYYIETPSICKVDSFISRTACLKKKEQCGERDPYYYFVFDSASPSQSGSPELTVNSYQCPSYCKKKIACPTPFIYLQPL